MFVGHYGISFAAKAADPALPLPVLMIATQVLDVVWTSLILLGIEKVRIIPKFTATNDLDLYFMPYSHSLTEALGWSALTGFATCVLLPIHEISSVVLIASVCFSHWLLDLLVHPRDLPLIGDRLKVGFGLWNYRGLTLAIELGILFAGVGFYAASLPPTEIKLGWLALGLSVALAALHTTTLFGSPPKSIPAFAASALAAYGAVPAIWIVGEHLWVY